MKKTSNSADLAWRKQHSLINMKGPSLDTRLSLGMTVPGSTRHHPAALIVADFHCTQIQELLADAAASVLWLDGNTPPISAVSQVLESYRRRGVAVQDLHWVSHGEPGKLLAGGAVIDQQALLQTQEQLASWQVQTLSLWACNLGSQASTMALWEEFTGASVFYSSQSLGRQQDGRTNWTLLNRHGVSSPALPIPPERQLSWPHQLGASTDEEPINVTAPITIYFSEAVIPKAGSIRIYKNSDGSLIDTIDVTSARVIENIATKATLGDYSYNMIAMLKGELVPPIAAALGVSETSKDNNQWAQEISNNWIMTAEGENYALTSSGPIADDSWQYYSTTPEYSPGSDGGTLNGGVNDRTVNFTPRQGLSKITIQPSAPLEAGTSYSIKIDDTAYASVLGGNFPGIADHASLTFSTAPDTVQPSLTSSTPSEGSEGIGISSDITLQFSEPVIAGTGKILIKDRITNTTFAEIHSEDSNLVAISGATVTINPRNHLDYATNYRIEIDALAFSDTHGNFFAGVNGTTPLEFTTESAYIYEGAYYENQPAGTVVAAVNGSDLPTKLRFKPGLGTTTPDGYYQFGLVSDTRIEVVLTAAGAAAGSSSNDHERGSNSFTYIIEEEIDPDAWGGWAAFKMNVLDLPDAFVASGTSGFGRKHADRITNFDPEANNKIQIDLVSFPGADSKLKIAKNAKQTAKAARRDTDFIFDNKAGFLYYNENGARRGFGGGGVFAIFEDKPSLGLNNFEFI
jgi:methionine-rich copper-binding protein CopC